MLKNIKSKFILKEILSLVETRLQLDLFKYNKDFQNKIDINLTNYKFFSKRYIIYEDNNQAKEYSYEDYNLIYEGGYLNKRRNGKGKEYNNDNELIYEGEFLNGKRNGNGKEYEYKGSLKFEGEYIYGRKWNGKIYDKKDKNIVYELKEGK